jgi:hypothetical protein
LSGIYARCCVAQMIAGASRPSSGASEQRHSAAPMGRRGVRKWAANDGVMKNFVRAVRPRRA